jgi:hypothetical protein
MGAALIEIAAIRMCVYVENAEIVSTNPLYPPILGGLLKAVGQPHLDHPVKPDDDRRPPDPLAGSVLHLFFSE